MVVFDANFLIYFLDPKMRGGVGQDARIDYLVETIQKSNERIVVPTPVLSELLVHAGDAGPKYLDIISRSKFFRIAEFGTRAAVEAAVLTREAIAKGDKRGAAPGAEWTKVKFDRQIVAIARAEGATTIYTNDSQLARHAEEIGIRAVTRDQLPEPPMIPQLELRLDPVPPEAQVDDDET